MRDYRHMLMGQEHISKLAADRSEPQRIQLWRSCDGQLWEIISRARMARTDTQLVVYRKYEPNGEIVATYLDEFMAEEEPGVYRFTREY